MTSPANGATTGVSTGVSTKADHIRELERTRDVTLPYFTMSEDVLSRSYAPGKWNLRQFLLHLADCEGVFVDRMRRVLAEDRPLLMKFDENRWAGLFPERRSLAIAANAFRACRESVIELARLAPAEITTRVGVHSGEGLRSFAQLLEKSWQHNAHHLTQIEAIVAGKPWQPRATPYAMLAEPRT